MAREASKEETGIICCCFRGMFACLCTFIFIIIALAIGLYFLFPSVPDISMGNPIILPGNPGLFITGDPLSGKPFQLSFEASSDVTVKSTSYIDIGIKELDIKVNIKDAAGNPIKNFIGNAIVADQQFPSRQTTTFNMPITISYNSTANGDILNDPAINVLKENCVSGGKNKIDSLIGLKLDIAPISWLGIQPSFSFDKELPCPDIAKLLTLINKP